MKRLLEKVAKMQECQTSDCILTLRASFDRRPIPALLDREALKSLPPVIAHTLSAIHFGEIAIEASKIDSADAEHQARCYANLAAHYAGLALKETGRSTQRKLYDAVINSIG